MFFLKFHCLSSGIDQPIDKEHKVEEDREIGIDVQKREEMTLDRFF